ncbi:MAG: SGNH/GDSL hydrolase family protein [Myxococcota bacterium]|nr:SGNH/GDSL hydrolase family protein [Myxococcota bacterium]
MANPTTQSSRVIKRVIFSFLPLLLLILSVELIVRWTGFAEDCKSHVRAGTWACDPLLSFKNDPSMVVRGQPLNSDGFRGREFGPKEDGVLRILALGDSCTFGVVPADNGYFVDRPYPELLEDEIGRKFGRDRIEVFNGGVPGYNSFQGLMLLRTQLRSIEPDVITVRFGWNDHLMSSFGRREGAFRESGHPLIRLPMNLIQRSAIYPASIRLSMELRAAIGVESVVSPRMPSEWQPNMSLEDYRYALEAISRLGQALGARVVLITAPQATNRDVEVDRFERLPASAVARYVLAYSAIDSFERMRGIHQSYIEATREVANKLAIPLVDMASVYRDQRDRQLFSDSDILHPTQRGHMLEARTLFQRLEELGEFADLLPDDARDHPKRKTRFGEVQTRKQ